MNPLGRLVVVSTPDLPSLRKALGKVAGGPFSWAYLGQSVWASRQAGEGLREYGTQIDIAERFHQAAEDLRGLYLQYAYQVGRQLNSLRWWITSVAQKNTYICKTFHQTCYLKVGLELTKPCQGPEPLVLVTEDRPVLQALVLNLPRIGEVRTEAIGPYRSPFLQNFRDFAKIAVRRLYFILREGYRILQCRRMLPRSVLGRQPITILVSYATQDTIKRGPRYHEAYFGDLAAELNTASPDRATALMPIILRDASFRDALRQLQDSAIPALIPYQHLGLLDLGRAAWASLSRAPAPPSWPDLAEMDVSPLLNEELRSYWISNRAADTLLMAAVVRRWKLAGLVIAQIIFVYENQPWERAICWQIRNLFPETRLVGYQHARVPRMMLNFYLATGGEPEAPQPDWVVTVGRHSANMLSNDGHHPSRVRVGGALQMQGLQASTAQEYKPWDRASGATVLVTTSNGPEEALELVEMAVNLVEGDRRIKVVLKCHPLLPFSRINSILGASLPSHVELSDRPVDQLMRESSVMVYSGTTVCIQALVLGLPLIHLRPSFDFDMDPLETTPHARLEATNLEELRQQVDWLLDNRESYIAQHRGEWSNLAAQMYGPVTQETIGAFLD